MKIYLAGSCGTDRRTHMVEIGKALRKAGFDVHCPFELKIENAWDMTQEEWADKVFVSDIHAIDAADIVVLISPGRVSTAGTNWEQGYAYAKGKQVIVFQYTTEATSLMTFCGCSSFIGFEEHYPKSPDDVAYLITSWVKRIVQNREGKFILNSILT